MSSGTSKIFGQLAIFAAVAGIVAALVSLAIPLLFEVEAAWFYQQLFIKILGVAGLIAVVLALGGRKTQGGRMALRVGAIMVLGSAVLLIMITGQQVVSSDPS